MTDYEYLMAPLMHHLTPLCQPAPDPKCGDCCATMQLVGPEMLFFACRECNPLTFSWEPYRADSQSNQ